MQRERRCVLKATLKKTITYRMGASTLGALVSFAYIGKPWLVLTITLTIVITNTAWYYLHERLWK